MQDVVSPLQNTSYTNKDFQRIYPELLDLVKELTNKWDPSISNESDPGVILIKLNALIADKCNYNIDKNVLECFPLSVTQNKNARQLFEQLGYYMRWYKSASSFISLKWIGDSVENLTYTIPAFTMVTDDNKSVVYTLVGYVPISSSQEFTVSDLSLPASGQTINAKAIQGVAVRYDINGDTVITPNHLDENNRIYFNVSNIAENGIFITNTGVRNYESWIKKDNLLVENFGNTFYKFGVTADGATCYIEFPEDAETVMRDGVEITYIRSDGENGNLMPSQITNFYSDVTVNSSSSSTVVLNAQNVQLTNYFASTVGYNPESINEAYKNYKKSIGTFNTLITLRDYLNYIVTNDLASNGFCCDRNADLQSTYSIMTYNNGINSVETVIESNDNEPILTAFSLKLYLLKYYSDVSTANLFNGTFQLMSDSQLQNVEDYILDVKSLQHDYSPLLPTNDSQSHFCFFKNKYPLKCTIIPQYKVSYTQENEIKENIKKALYQNLNSQEIEFGEKISMDYLYKIISESDSRIKNVILDSPVYTTYAVYLDNGDYFELPISGDINDSCFINAINSLGLSVSNYSVSIDSAAYINDLVTSGTYNYEPVTLTYNSGWKLDNQSVSLSTYHITLTGSTPSSGDKIIFGVSKQTQFRDEILVKSILAGVTPFFIQDELFDYTLDQSHSTSYSCNYITSEVEISVSNSSNTYTLRSNEGIKFYAPNLLQKAIYNNYVKFESNLQGMIEAGQYYELQANEYIIFYWKQSSSSAQYSYAAYGEGCIIMPTFNLSSTQSSTTTTQALAAELAALSTPKILTSNDLPLDACQSQVIASLTATENILSSDKAVSYHVINQITLPEKTNCYWVLNQRTYSGDHEMYQLFDSGETEYILKAGEYFFYTDNEMNSFISLGTGTKITRVTDSQALGVWSVPAMDLASITFNGITTLSGLWYQIPVGFTVDIQEQQFIQLSEGYILKVVPKQSLDSWSMTFKSDGTEITSTDTLTFTNFNISYKTNSADGEEYFVPNFNFSSSAPWNAKSLLAVNSSVDKEQILLDNQKVTFHQNDMQSMIATGSDLSDSKYSEVFKTTYDINFSGEGQLSTVEFDQNLNPIPMDIYLYTKSITRPSVVRYVGDNTSIKIPSGQSSSDQSRPPVFTLPEGDYLIPVVTPTLNNNTFITITIANISTDTPEVLHPIYDSTITRLAGNTLYPIYLKVNTSGINYKIIISLVDGSNNSVTASSDLWILLKNPYKFDMSSKTAKTLELIKMFDVDNVFDYTYSGNSNNLIYDPLDPLSFFSNNHIFNKYTICQLDTNSLTNLQVNS